MNKLFWILLLWFVSLSCQPSGQLEESGKDEQETTLSSQEKMAVRARYDSLMQIVSTLNSKVHVSSYLNACIQSLNDAQLLNNDTLLSEVYFKLGGYFDSQVDYASSIDYYFKALELFEKLQLYRGATVTLNNMSWVYVEALDYKKSIEQGFKGIETAEKIIDTPFRNTMKVLLYNNLSIACLEKGAPDSAMVYNKIAYTFLDKKNPEITNHFAWTLTQFGNIYAWKKEYEQAEDYFKKVIAIKDTPAVADAAVFAISRYCHLLNGLNRYKEAVALGQEGIRISRTGGGIRYLVEIADEMRYSTEKLNQVEKAFYYTKLATELRDSIFDARKYIQLQNMTFMRDLKANELQYEIEKAKTEENLGNAKMLRNIFLMGFILVLLFAILFFNQRNAIRAGKHRSDELLLNILPEEVADELKDKGYSSARQFDEVTVMFTDFKNFTQISERLSPQELVSEIHTCFKAFDEILEKYSIEKIKTIGDAYMCAGGLPVLNPNHALDVVNAALDIQHFIQQHLQQRKAEGKELFEIRIGIHTGPVVAGIVGIKKFAYDIWGDTVNTASRMESSGEAGKINISGTTYERVKNSFTCSYRGKIMVKNKGELDMYFVEG